MNRFLTFCAAISATTCWAITAYRWLRPLPHWGEATVYAIAIYALVSVLATTAALIGIRMIRKGKGSSSKFALNCKGQIGMLNGEDPDCCGNCRS